MTEQLIGHEREIVDETVNRINKTLPYPKSLSVAYGTDNVMYSMASGIIDESGGGSVHDVDYYTFSTEALSKLIFEAASSETKSAKTEVDAFRYKDYVDWPFGRVDGSEFHIENEPAKLHLEYKKRDNMDVIIIAEKNTDIPPQINTYGFLVLLQLADFRKDAKYKYNNMVYSFLGDPIIPDFGNLNDLETPCELDFDNYLTPETSSDGDYSEERRRILYFDKAMVIEALSKIEPGKTTKVTGFGKAAHFLERAGYGYNHNENTVELDIKNEVKVNLEITYFPTERTVIFNFKTTSLNPESAFTLNHSIKLSPRDILSSDVPVHFIGL